MLVVGAKAGPDEEGDRAVTCINLTRNFTAKIEAKMFADAIRREMAKGQAVRGNRCRWQSRELLSYGNFRRGRWQAKACHRPRR